MTICADGWHSPSTGSGACAWHKGVARTTIVGHGHSSSGMYLAVAIGIMVLSVIVHGVLLYRTYRKRPVGLTDVSQIRRTG